MSAMRGRGRRARRGLLALARPALVALSGLATAATVDAALIDPRGVGRDERPRGGGLRRTRRRAEDADTGRRLRDLELLDLRAATPPSAGECDQSTQHSLRFTFYADSDARSAGDGGWSISSSARGTRIDGGAMTAGAFGRGAVVEMRVCADKVQLTETYPNHFEPLAIESCYDTVMDASRGGGIGSFTLLMDGVEVATHTGTGRRGDSGFERCAFRACATSDGGRHTLSNLAGSDCELTEPRCDEAYHKERLVKVELKTDSRASDETSWELRKSNVNASPMLDAVSNRDLLMAGGSPVYDSEGRAWMGQIGVGVDLSGPPGERFASTTCMSADEAQENNGGCYDFRAYDARGDGLGRWSGGLIKVQVGRTRLVQRDSDAARGWAYCAVRVCADGTVRGLQGNQCEFGRGSELVDSRNTGKDPLEDGMDGFDFGDGHDAEEAEAPLPPVATDEFADGEEPPDEGGFFEPISFVKSIPSRRPSRGREGELVEEETVEEIEASNQLVNQIICGYQVRNMSAFTIPFRFASFKPTFAFQGWFSYPGDGAPINRWYVSIATGARFVPFYLSCANVFCSGSTGSSRQVHRIRTIQHSKS